LGRLAAGWAGWAGWLAGWLGWLGWLAAGCWLAERRMDGRTSDTLELRGARRINFGDSHSFDCAPSYIMCIDQASLWTATGLFMCLVLQLLAVLAVL